MQKLSLYSAALCVCAGISFSTPAAAWVCADINGKPMINPTQDDGRIGTLDDNGQVIRPPGDCIKPVLPVVKPGDLKFPPAEQPPAGGLPPAQLPPPAVVPALPAMPDDAPGDMFTPITGIDHTGPYIPPENIFPPTAPINIHPPVPPRIPPIHPQPIKICATCDNNGGDKDRDLRVGYGG